MNTVMEFQKTVRQMTKMCQQKLTKMSQWKKKTVTETCNTLLNTFEASLNQGVWNNQIARGFVRG